MQFITDSVTNGRADTLAAVTRILAVISAAPHGLISSEQVGAQLHLNPVVVRRLLAPMRSAGIVEARRGVGGGWAIARDPERLTLGAIRRALLGDAPAAPHPTDRLTDALAAAEGVYLRELDGITLADVTRS